MRKRERGKLKKTIAELSYKKKVFNDFDHCEFNRSEHKTKTFLVPVTAKLSITMAATTNLVTAGLLGLAGAGLAGLDGLLLLAGQIRLQLLGSLEILYLSE